MKYSIEQIEEQFNVKKMVFFNDSYEIPKEQKTGICSCGNALASRVWQCEKCNSYASIYYSNKNNETEQIMAIWYDVETKSEKEAIINRYDLIYKINTKEKTLTKEIRKKGYLQYYFGKPLECFVIQKDGAYKKVRNVLDLSKYAIRNHTIEKGISKSNLDKCEYLLKRTGLEEYLNDSGLKEIRVKTLLEYLQYLQENPEVELLMKSGKVHIAKQLIKKNYKISTYFQTSTKASKIIQLPPYLQKVINERKISVENIKLFEKINKNGGEFKEEFVEYMIEHQMFGTYDLGNVLRCINDLINLHFSNKEIFDYLNKADLYQAIEPKESIELWRDYVHMGVEGNIIHERFPNSLKKSHDLLIREYKFIEDELINQKYQNIKRENEKYEYEDDQFAIITPTNTSEVVREGKVLKHCVASYIKRMAEGNTVILFLRRKTDITKPFYTIEMINGTVTQIKGFANEKVKDKKLTQFINQWIKSKKIDNKKIA